MMRAASYNMHANIFIGFFLFFSPMDKSIDRLDIFDVDLLLSYFFFLTLLLRPCVAAAAEEERGQEWT